METCQSDMKQIKHKTIPETIRSELQHINQI